MLKSNILVKTTFAIVLVCAVAMIIIGCEKEDVNLTFGEPKTFFKIGNEDTLTAPAYVYFINGSQNVDSYFWNFPNGKVVVDGTITNKSTYDGIQPSSVLYEEPGSYKASLTTKSSKGEETVTLDVEVLKPQPKISYDVPAIKFLEPVVFSVSHYTYPGKEGDVTYEWDFGNGETSTQASPTYTYATPGSYTVTCKVNDTKETLVATRAITVKGELAQTLYFTDAITNKLMGKKLFTQASSDPFVTDLSLGLHPLGVEVYGEQIIVTEAGDNIKFSAWGSKADGQIIKSNLAGQNVKVITTTNTGGNAYVRDPFSCTVDDEGNVYWLNRFEGIRKLPIVSENAEYPAVFIALLAADIGESSTYGWTDGDVNFVDGEIWYSKHGSGKGLYKFNIDGSYNSKIDAFGTFKIRAFAVDLDNLKIYFAMNQGSGDYAAGLYVADIDGNNIMLIDEMADFSNEGGATERTFITDMVIDKQNGYLYYPYRSKSDINDSGEVIGDGSNSGIKRYKLDGSESPSFYVTGAIPYGVGIDEVNR